MFNFTLHPRLKADCIELGKLAISRVLLLNNGHYKWFILVPEVEETELHKLSTEDRNTLFSEAQLISEFLGEQYPLDKINVGAIGNMVPQLHYHIVGRRKDDPAWPGVVWGHPESKVLSESEIAEIRISISDLLKA